jgi:hypothetical protein
MAAIGQVQIQASWVLDPGIVPTAANQILIQPGLPAGQSPADGFYLYLGHISPPAFPTEEAALFSAQQGAVHPVIPVARVYVSRDRLEAFHEAIGQALSRPVEPPVTASPTGDPEE